MSELRDALARLENRLRLSRAAIVPLLHPGAREPEILAAFDTIGLSPSTEVATWFGWHDGAGDAYTPSNVIELVPGGEFYDLHFLCDEYLQTRSTAVEVASMPGNVLSADQLWHASWFPILRLFGKGFLAADLASGTGSTSPVHIVWHDSDPDERSRVVWPTISAFVETVINRFESGVYSVSDDGIVQGPTIDLPRP